MIFAAFNALQCMGWRLFHGGRLLAWQIVATALAGAAYSALWDHKQKLLAVVLLTVVNYLVADDDLPRRLRRRLKQATSTITDLQRSAFRRECRTT